MNKSKIILTASALLIAVGGVFAAAFAPEPGFIFDSTQPVGSKCITLKECQITNTTRPLCQVVINQVPFQLYRQTAIDACSTVLLYELPE